MLGMHVFICVQVPVPSCERPCADHGTAEAPTLHVHMSLRRDLAGLDLTLVAFKPQLCVASPPEHTDTHRHAQVFSQGFRESNAGPWACKAATPD